MKRHELVNDFSKLSYFQYITKPVISTEKQKLHQSMLKGNFKVNIGDEMVFSDKVLAYANEDLTYHLYQKGLMMKQLKRKTQQKDEFTLPKLINKVLRQQYVKLE